MSMISSSELVRVAVASGRFSFRIPRRWSELRVCDSGLLADMSSQGCCHRCCQQAVLALWYMKVGVHVVVKVFAHQHNCQQSGLVGGNRADWARCLLMLRCRPPLAGSPESDQRHQINMLYMSLMYTLITQPPSKTMKAEVWVWYR